MFRIVRASLVVAAVHVLLIPGLLWANPASREVFDRTQPDGSVIQLRSWGDEFANGVETLDGQAVVLDDRGWWVYGILDSDGRTIPSAQRVGQDSPPVPPRARPQAVTLTREGEEAAPWLPRPTEPQAAPGWAHGTVNVLYIMMQFPADPTDPDGPQPAVACTFGAAAMQANLLGTAATGPGNLDDYYREVSFGALGVSPGPAGIIGCFNAANDKNDYDDGPRSAADLVAEAVAAADPTVDFGPYDHDGDGRVDTVVVIYAGAGPDWNRTYVGANPNVNNLWPHSWHISPVSVDGGARTVSEYYIVPELLSAGWIRTIGVHAHEFGHKLGLPDLYDTDSPPNQSEGVGHWCLMGSGSWTSNVPGRQNGESPAHMSAWAKWFEGWITPADRTGANSAETLPAASGSATAVRLLANPGGPDDWPGNGEYFLLENRQQSRFDRGLDGCGLLVWHVDESRGNNADQGHTAAHHRLVDLEEADGPPEDLDQTNGTGNRGDAGDPFPGSSHNTRFNDATTPHARLYSGANSGASVAMVDRGCQDAMEIAIGDPAPFALCPGNVTVECQGNEQAATPLDGSRSYDAGGQPVTFLWSSATCTIGDPTAAIPTVSCPVGDNTVTLIVNDGTKDSAPCTTAVHVVDTLPPSGSITFPADGACFGPAQLPVVVQDDFADICDPTLVRTYDPVGGPSYSAHGDYTVKVTATDASGNSAYDTVSFTIDTQPPVVRLVWPDPRRALIPMTLPMSVVFRATDQDGASGGVVREVVKLAGCTVYDGMTYGDGDGLLSDETLALSQAELCRVAAMCGFTVLTQPVLRVEATDCGGNTGVAHYRFGGSVMLKPGICGP